MTNLSNHNQLYNNGEIPFSYNSQRKSSDADYKKKRRNEDENTLSISMDNVIVLIKFR